MGSATLSDQLVELGLCLGASEATEDKSAEIHTYDKIDRQAQRVSLGELTGNDQ